MGRLGYTDHQSNPEKTPDVKHEPDFQSGRMGHKNFKIKSSFLKAEFKIVKDYFLNFQNVLPEIFQVFLLYCAAKAKKKIVAHINKLQNRTFIPCRNSVCGIRTRQKYSDALYF